MGYEIAETDIAGRVRRNTKNSSLSPSDRRDFLKRFVRKVHTLRLDCDLVERNQSK